METDGVNAVVTATEGWKCLPIHKASIETVTENFRSTKDFSFQVFHFAGHAIDQSLQFNDRMPTIEEMDAGVNYLVGVGGLSGIIKAMHPIQLVFLNGCSTEAQVKAFKDAGIPAVIYTTEPLNDKLGMLFAKQFYAAFFKANATLGQAFDIAKAFITALKGNFENDGLDPQILEIMNRGGGAVSRESAIVNKELYELEASEEFKQKRWSDWPAPPQTDKSSAKKDTIPPANVLYLNRDFQIGVFKTCLSGLVDERKKDKKDWISPQFFFIHALNHACPTDFGDRLKTFGAGEFCEAFPALGIDPKAFVWQDMQLPELNLMADEAAFKRRLHEIYGSYFQHIDDRAAGKFTFHATTQRNNVFLIHHSLVEWNPQSLDEVKLLLNFYLKEFGWKLKEELSASLAVIFTFQYYQPDSEFAKLFNELANDPAYKPRVKNLTDLKMIDMGDVVAWQKKVFKGRTTPMPPDEDALFPFDKPSVSLKEAKKVIVQKLEEYNLEIERRND
jgi:hypothetical protein